MKKSDEKKGKSDKVKHNGQQEGQSFMQPKAMDNPFLDNTNQKTTNPFGTVQMKGNSQSNVLADMGKSFGTDFSDVKIHTNSKKASKMGAHAFAQGNDVHFAQGKFDPSTKTGKQLIGHELSHVVQQRNGAVKPNIQMKGLNFNTEDRLESEADKQGALAAEGKAVQTKAVSASSIKSENAPIQGFSFGGFFKGALNSVKSFVVDSIPQEFKDMVPAPLREMASNMADKGIEVASGMADKGANMLLDKAKSKLAASVPPGMRDLIDKIPPEVRQYIEGLLEKGGQLAQGALDSGQLPSGDELKQFGKDAAKGGVDLGAQMLPKMIPPDIKELVSKLPPEMQDFIKEKYDQGTEGLKGAIDKGEMPDVGEIASNVANEAKDVAIGAGTRIATEKATEILQGLPGNVTKAIDSLPDDVRKVIMSLLPDNVKKEEAKPTPEEPKPEEVAEQVVEAAKEEPAVTPELDPVTPEPTPEVKPEPAKPTPTPKPAGKKTPNYMKSTASSRAKQTTKRAGSSSLKKRKDIRGGSTNWQASLRK